MDKRSLLLKEIDEQIARESQNPFATGVSQPQAKRGFWKWFSEQGVIAQIFIGLAGLILLNGLIACVFVLAWGIGNGVLFAKGHANIVLTKAVDIILKSWMPTKKTHNVCYLYNAVIYEYREEPCRAKGIGP